MKVITMESSAYKEMMAQIANIAGYIREARDEKKRKRETEDKLLDTAQAAKMLNVSKRTMQRMRTDHRIEYVVVRGSCRYRLSEILRLLEDNTVRNEPGDCLGDREAEPAVPGRRPHLCPCRSRTLG